MTMTNEKQQPGGEPSGQDLVEQLKASGQLDALFAQIDAGKVELTGDSGFVPALVKAALERGLQAELTIPRCHPPRWKRQPVNPYSHIYAFAAWRLDPWWHTSLSSIRISR